MSVKYRTLFVVVFTCVLGIFVYTQTVDRSLYQSMRWRMIGPFRAGRTVGAAGIPSQPNVFYIGVNNGGVWKTTDAGRTWQPIFDDQPTGSIGDIAVAPSNPNVIYVGSGEGLQRPDLSTGDGMYRSSDAGRTWVHLGLREGQQIASIAVDPKDENKLYVAVLGHPYGPNEERGIYKSTDGGRSFQRVLYIDQDTGGFQVEIDPRDNDTIYADMWAGRQGPWENGAWQGKTSGLFKSTDGGKTWKKLTNGLPTIEQGLGRIGFAISRSDRKRLYATVDANAQVAGIYRSDDGGEKWQRMNGDTRLWGRGSDFAEVKVHPTNPDIVFVANVASFKSTDGGKTFVSFKGAPGGDDYHRIWINPDNPNIMLFAVDQGATITVNGGETWSSWYNQPTAQFYHVIADNDFPYRVCGGQQESGSACVVSRGRTGAIHAWDWETVGVEEYGYVAPDPLDPNIVYGGKLTRFDRRTRQVQYIMPEAVRTGKYRFLRTAPVIFSPVDNRTLYFAGNVLFKTTSGGKSWDIISPDLSREKWDVPENVGVYRTPEMTTMARRGVIYTVAPSYKDINTIWAGTDDGLIHVTHNGGRNWQNVTPPQLRSWAKVSLIDAGRFDANTAYAAVNTFRLDDLRPHIYRTHDSGRTWKEITRGIPDGGIVNAVREDPVRKGLLFAGTEQAVYFSIDDGENWQPLRLNMPATSIRDLVVKDDDIVVGTHGRSFWILDDITPLRKLSAASPANDAILFTPQRATRVKRSLHTDTPFPPEEPAGENPPDGAIINYYLRSRSASPITLEIIDAAGKVVRKFSSDDKPLAVDTNRINPPTYWIRPFQPLKNEPGMQRFVWDLMYPNPPSDRYDLPISAIFRDTPFTPQGPYVLPGRYTVRLTVNGRTHSQPLVIRMDPRVTTSPVGLKQQFDLSYEAYNGIIDANTMMSEVNKLSAQLRDAHDKAAGTAEALKAIEEMQQRLRELTTGQRTPTSGPPQPTVITELPLGRLASSFTSMLDVLQDADVTPTTQAVRDMTSLRVALAKARSNWALINTRERTLLSEKLRSLGISLGV